MMAGSAVRAVAGSSLQMAKKERAKERALLFGFMFAFGPLLLPFILPQYENVRWVLFCVVTGVWLICHWGDLSSRRFASGLWLLIVANIGLRLMSIWWSPFPSYTAMRSISLAILFLFLAGWTSRSVRQGKAHVILSALALCACLTILPGIAAHLLGLSTFPLNGQELWRGHRFAGMLGNANQVGICVALAAPAILGLCWRERRKRYQLMLLSLLGCCLLALWWSGSRGGMLATSIGLASFLGLYYRVRWFPFMAVILIGCFLLVSQNDDVGDSAQAYITRNGSMSMDFESIAGNRLEPWREGLESILKRPILGQGYGVGGIGALTFEGHDYGYPLHNSYLQACQENGIIGVGLIVCVMLFVLAHASRCSISKSNRGAPVVEAAVGAVCIAGIVNSCFEAWIVSVGNLATMPFWACVFTFLSLERCPQKARLPQNGVKASIS